MKKRIFLMLALIISVLTTGCGSESETQTTEKIFFLEDGQKNVEQNSDRWRKETVESLLKDMPTYMNKKYDENFEVNADIDVPEIKKLNILYAKSKRLDEQKLHKLFFKDEESTLQVDDNIFCYENEIASLVVADTYTMFRTNWYENVRFPIDSFHMKYESDTSGKNIEDVYIQNSVSFMEKEKAIQKAKEIINNCSIEEIEESEVYAIDVETMQEQQKQRIQDAIEIQKRMGITPLQDPTEGYLYKENLGKENECYLMCFRIMQDGIPITQKSYYVLDGERILNGSIVKVVMAENGLIAFESNGIYEIERVAESAEDILNVEEAVGKFYEISNRIYSTDKLIVEKISLEYVPVPYNENYNEVKLVPAWSMLVTYNHGLSEKDGTELIDKRVICLNALTGEKIY